MTIEDIVVRLCHPPFYCTPDYLVGFSDDQLRYLYATMTARVNP